MWLQENHLTLNVKKTVLFIFLIEKKRQNKNRARNGGLVLGTVVDSQLKFDKHKKKT